MTYLLITLSCLFFVGCLADLNPFHQEPEMTEQERDTRIIAAGGKIYRPQKITKEQAEKQKENLQKLEEWRYSKQ